jgi:transmembrane sensor
LVRVSDTTVRDLGTEFTARLRNDGSVDVLVSDGQVEIGGVQFPESLAAGDAATVRDGHIQVKRLTFDESESRLGWTRGWLFFQHTAMQDAIDEINRYSRSKLVLGDTRIAKMTIGGRFRPTELDNFVATLRALQVEVHRSRDRNGVEIIRLDSPSPSVPESRTDN